MSPRNQRRKGLAFEDNEGAIKLINNPPRSSRLKHIHVRYHFTRKEIQEGNASVVYVESSDQSADIMAKGLPQHVYMGHRRCI